MACGVCFHVPRPDLQQFYDAARDAMHKAEKALKSSDPGDRVVIVSSPAPPIDPELKALLEPAL